MKIKRRYVFKRRMWLENFKKGVWGVSVLELMVVAVKGGWLTIEGIGG